MAVTAQASRGSYLKVKFSGGVKSITGLLDATFTQTMETIDVTELSSTRRQFIPGVLSGTISGNLYYDQSDADFALFEQAIAQGYSSGTTYFEIEVGWTASAAYTAKAVFTEWTVTTAQQDVVRVSFSAQIHDTVSIT